MCPYRSVYEYRTKDDMLHLMARFLSLADVLPEIFWDSYLSAHRHAQVLFCQFFFSFFFIFYPKIFWDSLLSHRHAQVLFC